MALITTLLLLTLLATTVTTALLRSGVHTRITGNLQRGLQATYVAQAGIQHALLQLGRRVTWRDGIAETTFGSGTYQVTVSQPAPGDDLTLQATAVVAGASRTVRATLRQVLLVLAGTGVQGDSGDGGPAVAARLNKPSGVYVDGAGNLYIADRDNHRVRRVEASTGIISTVAGTGQAGYSGDGGAATAARLNKPSGVYVDGAGNLYIADRDNHRVRRVEASTGIISTVAGTGQAGYSGDGGAAVAARLNKPSGVYVDGAGNLYIADRDNHRVRRVEASTGIISTVAGSGVAGYSGDGGPAVAARLNKPSGVYVDGAGNLYIADRDNHRVRRVEASTGIISTVAGSGVAGYSGDGGPAVAARLNKPSGVYVDGAGNLYIADRDNHRVRRVSPGADEVVTGAADEVIATVAGMGIAANGGSGGSATATPLRMPSGVYVDAAGNLYLADEDNHRVRRTQLRLVRWEE
ncbi:MAG: hypothetical protein KatS3mg131_0116 [Candidatus Tectimicrobiota bacterium]|nr:MAG: hypothetical protein KatS3mg131_0116 [Candidatus Tectomicrobia bacterium]